MQPELIADYACQTGEGPLWHPDEKRLYWVDIPQGRMFRYDPATGEHEQCYQGEQIGGFTIQEDGALLLFMERGAIKTWHDGRMKTILDEIPDERGTRFNDVSADPEGRVFCGTMPAPDRPGRLYRLDTDGRLSIILEGIGCSNGIGFTPDLRGMYHTDSPTKAITLFDYDRATGEITNRRVFTQASDGPGEGVPDGMTVDAEGHVWSARWGGHCVVRYAPDGTEVRRIMLPPPKVSSITFGGQDYSQMYLTTAGGNVKDEDGPEAGALYRVDAGVKGVAEFRSKIGL